MASFCTNCSAVLDGAKKFCTSCGAAVQTPVQQPAHQPHPINQPQAPAKKKSKKLLIIGGATGAVALTVAAVLIFNSVFGLFGNESGSNSDPTSENNNPTSTSSGGNNGGGNVNGGSDDPVVTDPFVLNYDWTNFDPADFINPLGDATFTVDSANSATGEFFADDETPLSLSLTDSAGAVWTLDIPAFALLSPETIKMTALSDVKLGGDTLDGGVLLSPAGLTFIQPATLTVRGPGCGEDSVIFEGEHDGNNMTFTEFDTGDGYVSATIWHFSTRVKGSGKGGGASVSMLQLLVDMGNEILRQPLQAPEPPSLTFKCPGFHSTDKNIKNKAIMDFMLKCTDPELEARQTIKRAIANYRGQDAILAQAMDMVMKLEQRFADKINMLIYQYKYQEDKLAAIFTLSVYGTWNRDDKYGIDYEEIYKWVAEAWNELMRELVEDHDYTRAHSLTNLISVVKSIYTLRGIDLDTTGFERRLGNALTFRVEWKLHNDAAINGNWGLQVMDSSTEAIISMNQFREKEGFYGEDAGVGRVDYYNVGDGAPARPDVSFRVNARLFDLDPCMKKTITVSFDNPGAVDFHVTLQPGNIYSEYAADFASEILKGKLTDGFYVFELPIINLRENCVEVTVENRVEQSADGITLSLMADITFIIIHTPMTSDVYLR